MRSAPGLVVDAASQLAAAGIDSPRVDAELLLAAILDVPRSRLVTLGPVTESVAAAYTAQVARRVRREPLQHITGVAPFRHLLLAVGPGVFVPRPETELLVDAVLPHLRATSEPTVVDLCAGSGALALAIAEEVPEAQVIAVEQSFAAARWLTRNAAGTRVHVVTDDIRDPDLLRALTGRADVVVSNPPYLPSGTEVSPEVLADPHEALFAGGDGLALIPTVLARAAALLRPDGVVAIEHDETQSESVPALVQAGGRFADVVDHADLSGRARFVTARRCGEHR